jgi:Ca2+-binding RTX toxin-like protein
MTLGNISTRYGTANNDTITGGNLQAVLGLAGDDRLTAGSSNGIPSVLAGGLGDDTYIIPTGQSATVLESGGTDTVVFPFSGYSSTQFIATVDNRHLIVGDSATNTYAIRLSGQYGDKPCLFK